MANKPKEKSIEFGRRLEESIENRGWKKNYFAKVVGISAPGLQDFIKGRVPNAIDALKFAETLDVDLRWLLTGETDRVRAEAIDIIHEADEFGDEIKHTDLWAQSRVATPGQCPNLILFFYFGFHSESFPQSNFPD